MQTDREQDGLKGAAHTVRTRVVKLPARMPRPPSSGNTLRQLLTYDPQGHKTEEVTYSEDDTVARRVVFDRDENGALRETRMYDHTGALFLRSVYQRDAEGKKVEELSYGGDGTLTERALRLYNDAGQVQEWAMYSADGALMMKFVTRFDEQGREMETLICHGGATRPLMRFEQTEAGELTAIMEGEVEMARSPECGGEGFVAGSIRYTYAETGEMIEVATFDSDGNLTDKHAYSESDDGSRGERREYDAAGTLTSRETYGRELDEHGNWTKEIVASWVAQFSRDGVSEPEPTEEHYREITYH